MRPAPVPATARAEVLAALRSCAAELGLDVVDVLVSPDPDPLAHRTESWVRLEVSLPGLPVESVRAVWSDEREGWNHDLRVRTSWKGSFLLARRWCDHAEFRGLLAADLDELTRPGVRRERVTSNADVALAVAARSSLALRGLLRSPRRADAVHGVDLGLYRSELASVLEPLEVDPWAFDLVRPILLDAVSGAPLEWLVRRHGARA